jgi:hypothetical protein
MPRPGDSIPRTFYPPTYPLENLPLPRTSETSQPTPETLHELRAVDLLLRFETISG